MAKLLAGQQTGYCPVRHQLKEMGKVGKIDLAHDIFHMKRRLQNTYIVALDGFHAMVKSLILQK